MSAQFSHSIDEELIAAYVDGEVTAEERLRVESAMAASEQVAWEVESLRRTVGLLREMPRAALPRSFVLTESQVEDVLQARRARNNPSPAPALEAPSTETPWQRLLSFLAGGNPLYRNAALVAAVLLLVVVAADIPLQQGQIGDLSTGSGQSAAQTATPRIQVTSVGGAASTSGGSGTAVPEEQGNDGFQVMSTTESRSSNAETGEESNTSIPQSTPQHSVPTVVAPPDQAGNEGSGVVLSPLRSLLRSARIVLVLAIIVFWLLSRRRPRHSGA